jgi:hypothetical protein
MYTYICMYNLSSPYAFSYSKLLLTVLSPTILFQALIGLWRAQRPFSLNVPFQGCLLYKGENSAHVAEMVYTQHP